MLKAALVTMMASLTIGFGVVAWLTLHPGDAPATAQAPAPPAPPPAASILVAARALAPGALLKPEDIGVTSVPADAVPPGARPDTPADRAALAGAMARRGLAAQQPVLPADVLRPSEGGFLAAVLGPHQRAVSVAVDAVSGTAGLIWPGDRVDVILTQTLEDAATPVGRRTLGETVLLDVRVVAVDQQIAHAAGGEATQGGRTVTLSVTPLEAERMAVAVRLGRVALAVRPSTAAPPAAEDVTPTAFKTPPPPAPKSGAAPGTAPVNDSSTTWGQDVSPGLAPRRTASAPVAVRVFQGASSEKEFKFE